MLTEEKWVCTSEKPASDAEGSHLFENLWSRKSRPEGLLVFPDVMARGVMVAMLKHRVRVPEDVKVIFHLNAEMEFYCPLAVEWIVTHVNRLADALIASIQRQVAGDTPSKIFLPLELTSSSELEGSLNVHPQYCASPDRQKQRSG